MSSIPDIANLLAYQSQCYRKERPNAISGLAVKCISIQWDILVEQKNIGLACKTL